MASGQSAFGAIAKRLCSGLQSRLGRFDSGSRLQHEKKSPASAGLFFFPHFYLRIYSFGYGNVTRSRVDVLLPSSL